MTVNQAEREREDRVIKVAKLFISKGPRGRATWDELFKEVFGSVPPKATKEERSEFEDKRKEIKSIIAEVSMMFGVLIHPSFPPGSRESVYDLLADEDELGVLDRLVKKHEARVADSRRTEELLRKLKEQDKEDDRTFVEKLQAFEEEEEKRLKLLEAKKTELHSVIRDACSEFLKDVGFNSRTVRDILFAFHTISHDLLPKLDDAEKEEAKRTAELRERMKESITEHSVHEE